MERSYDNMIYRVINNLHPNLLPLVISIHYSQTTVTFVFNIDYLCPVKGYFLKDIILCMMEGTCSAMTFQLIDKISTIKGETRHHTTGTPIDNCTGDGIWEAHTSFSITMREFLEKFR